MNRNMECKTCQSLRGEISLAPGPIIYEGRSWRIEHVAPTALKGWVVIILKRHATALHGLSDDEFSEFALLSRTAIKLLFKKFACEKEYMTCFAEGDGFRHIHVHIIPKPVGLPSAKSGPHVFQLLGPEVAEPLSEQKTKETCTELKKLFQEELKGASLK